MIPDYSNLALFMIATVTLNLTPGPDLLYVIAQSIGQGRWAGIVSSLGIASGCLVHTFAVTFGITGLFLVIPSAYDVVRYAGAAYLVYLGIRVLTSPSGLPTSPEIKRRSLRSIFWQGVITNILNPKVALFFLAFLPQFIDANSPQKALAFVLLGLIFNVGGTAWLLMVAWAASRTTSAIRDSARIKLWLERAIGTMFVALGVKLALSERP